MTDWRTPPGDTLHELLNERGITPAQFAGRVGISGYVLDRLLAGDYPITGQIARKLAAGTGVPAGFWKRRQAHYTAWRTGTDGHV